MTDDDQSTAMPASSFSTTSTQVTRKRKIIFPNTQHKIHEKKLKVDHFRYMKDEIIDYINDDTCDDDSNRLILLNQPNKYKSLNKLAKKILTVPATSSSGERIFSQSSFLFSTASC